MEQCDYKIRAVVKKDFLDNVILLFDSFKKQNVNVFARDGLLLGAIRHKGFLPFDIDPDVGILAEHYSDLENAKLPKGFILDIQPSTRNAKYFLKTGVPYEFRVCKSGYTEPIRIFIIAIVFLMIVFCIYKLFNTRKLKYLSFLVIILVMSALLIWLIVPLFKGETILDGTVFPKGEENNYYQEVEKGEKAVFNKEYGHAGENVFRYNREDFFPLVSQPFYYGKIQVPNKSVKILSEHYGKDVMNVMYKKEDAVKEKIDISKCIPPPATVLQ
jgi:hypothetical protein